MITTAEAKFLADALQGGTAENCIATLTFTKTMTDGADACRELAKGIAKATGLRMVNIDGIEVPRHCILFEGKETRGEFREDRKITSLDWTKIGFDTSDADDLMVFIVAELLKDKRCCLL